MYISLRETGDLCLQMVLAVALTLSGMGLASAALKPSQQGVSAIDVNSPALWSAGPVRVDVRDRDYARTAVLVGAEMAAGEGPFCHDAIGLRMPCDLLPVITGSTF